MRGYDERSGRREEKHRRHRKDSDSGSETDGRSLELASSHSSDEEESRTGRSTTGTHRSTGVSATPTYLPNITEHVQATTPPELNVVQSPQYFPGGTKQPVQPIYGTRWSSQAPDGYLPQTGARWSQETGSDNEQIHAGYHHNHKPISPNPLPNPDLTDTSYLHQHQNKMNMPPSILENIQNVRNDNVSNGYDMERENLYGSMRRKDYQDNYGQYKTSQNGGDGRGGTSGGGGGSQVVNHFRTFHNESPYLMEKQRPVAYLGNKTDSPYMSKERITPLPDIYGSREPTQTHYSMKSPPLYNESMLKHQHQQSLDYHSDRMSEGSDKNGYHFPYTAEEDHISSNALNRNHNHNIVNDVNNPGAMTINRSRQSSRASSPPSSVVAPMQPLAPLTAITDTE